MTGNRLLAPRLTGFGVSIIVSLCGRISFQDAIDKVVEGSLPCLATTFRIWGWNWLPAFQISLELRSDGYFLFIIRHG